MSGGLWKLRCDDHTSEHRTKEQAEQQKVRVEEAGYCRLAHEIVPPRSN